MVKSPENYLYEEEVEDLGCVGWRKEGWERAGDLIPGFKSRNVE